MKIFCVITMLFIAAMVNTSRVMAQDNCGNEVVIKRYVVERTYPETVVMPMNCKGGLIAKGVGSKNAEEQFV